MQDLFVYANEIRQMCFYVSGFNVHIFSPVFHSGQG